MKNRNRRILCALCALIMLFTAVMPVSAFAEQAVQPVQQTLSASDALEMQRADTAVSALTESDEFTEMDRTERKEAAFQQLEQLAQDGLIEKDSIYADDENGMVSFTYTCGALGGILLDDPDEENAVDTPDGASQGSMQQALQLTAEQGETEHEQIGTAVLYYAFDNTVNSTRYPSYAYMQNYWTSQGLETKLNTTVTVSDLRHMDDYDVSMISAHGAYYTYEYGRFWKRTATEPVILLQEKSDFYKDLRYGVDLLLHRIIKVNGAYAVTDSFFRAAYRKNQLSGKIILSETCEFFGENGHADTGIADALLARGASVVVGFVNNVYAVYSRSMMWTIVNRLMDGDTISTAVNYALDCYGDNDILWYNAQGGRKPHATASYPLVLGDQLKRLYEPAEAASDVQMSYDDVWVEQPDAA